MSKITKGEYKGGYQSYILNDCIFLIRYGSESPDYVVINKEQLKRMLLEDDPENFDEVFDQEMAHTDEKGYIGGNKVFETIWKDLGGDKNKVVPIPEFESYVDVENWFLAA